MEQTKQDVVICYKPDDFVYVYSSHTGGYYASQYNSLETYCGTCGNSDYIVWSGVVRDFMNLTQDELEEHRIYID